MFGNLSTVPAERRCVSTAARPCLISSAARSYTSPSEMPSTQSCRHGQSMRCLASSGKGDLGIKDGSHIPDMACIIVMKVRGVDERPAGARNEGRHQAHRRPVSPILSLLPFSLHDKHANMWQWVNGLLGPLCVCFTGTRLPQPGHAPEDAGSGTAG